MKEITLCSLFDGSGGFPLAAALCGIKATTASEIEPYPIAVTRSRFPEMVHLGDVSKINGAEILPADIISFGSPCQDLSVAGQRAGMKHQSLGDEETTRSGLFLDAIRIIKEMREATNGRYPTFALWENVPGAFSSNRGEDFREVLNAFVHIMEEDAEVPPPYEGKWPTADLYVGPGWSLAYRTLDAQYWGVPQRRRRIYLVADFRGERAGAVLFERKGLRRHFEEIRATWEGTAADPAGCLGEAGQRIALATGNGQMHQTDLSDKVGAINCMHDQKIILSIDRASFNQGQNALWGTSINDDGTTQTIVAKGPNAVMVPLENHPNDSRIRIEKGNAMQTLPGNMGTGGNNTPLVMNVDAQVFDARHDRTEDVSGTLQAKSNGGYSLNYTNPVFNGHAVRRLTPRECQRLQGFPDGWGDIDRKESMDPQELKFWREVRRTAAEIKGQTVKDWSSEQMLNWYNKLQTDSAQYKMWGNGIALPCALYVFEGLADALKEEEDE